MAHLATQNDATLQPQAGSLGHRFERVVILNDLAEMKGGATGIAMLTARMLQRHKIRTTFVSGHASTDPALGEITTVGSQHLLEGSRSAAMVRGLYNIKTAKLLSEWIAEHDTARTVYHLHGWSKILSPSVFGALRPVADRLLVHAHDFFLTCPNGGYFDFRRGVPCEFKPLGRRCLSTNCDRRSFSHKLWRSARLAIRDRLLDLSMVGRVVVVHEDMIPILQSQCPDGTRIEALRNPAQAWTSQRVEAERNKTLLYVGRLDVDKGVDLLAEAARRAEVPLRMIGSGPLTEMLERDYPEIELCGWQTREGIADLCQEARAVIVPTRSRETFGIAAVEALMSGLPVIISKHAMISGEVVAHGCGESCDPQEIDGLALLLNRFAEVDALIGKMSHAAFGRGREVAPTPDTWLQSLIRHYEALPGLAASPGGSNGVRA